MPNCCTPVVDKISQLLDEALNLHEDLDEHTPHQHAHDQQHHHGKHNINYTYCAIYDLKYYTDHGVKSHWTPLFFRRSVLFRESITAGYINAPDIINEDINNTKDNINGVMNANTRKIDIPTAVDIPTSIPMV